MPMRRFAEFLDRFGVRYLTARYSPGYAAQEIATSTHIPGKVLAKTVIVELDGQTAMAVIPATHIVDLQRLAALAGARRVQLASEEKSQKLFPDCEVGAMPPFGNLWHVPVYVSEVLAGDEGIAFNAGAHTEVVILAFDDFKRLVEPRIARISERA